MAISSTVHLVEDALEQLGHQRETDLFSLNELKSAAEWLSGAFLHRKTLSVMEVSFRWPVHFTPLYVSNTKQEC